MIFGIDVIVVAPGAVATPIWDKADAVDASQYANTPYLPALETIKKVMLAGGRNGFTPERLGRAVIHKALTTAHPKTPIPSRPTPLQNIAGQHPAQARWWTAIYAKRLVGLKRVKN